MKNRIEKILNIWKRMAEKDSRLRERMQMLTINGNDECAEPGYNTDHPVWLFCNWNTFNCKDDRDIMRRIGNALENCGARLEWHDEWDNCDECNSFFRTQPDSYDWQPSYAIINEYERVCNKCINECVDMIVEEHKGTCRALPQSIDPLKHGFKKLKGELESGFHHGQNDNPQLIAKRLESLGIDEYVFQVDAKGQFDIQFSVYIDEQIFDGGLAIALFGSANATT